ncbi:unnamed protein product, partial [Hapterophycus canaliculatus]
SFLQLSATRHLNTDSDTELLSELFGMELAARRPAIGSPVTRELLFRAVMARCRGGYAVTVLINGYGILAFRDPNGVRPLCLGARPGGGDTGVMDLAVASESAALTGL